MEFLELFKRQLTQTSNGISKISLKNYLSDIRHFINWFEYTTGNTFSPKNITAEVIELYIASQGAVISDGNLSTQDKLSPSSMKRHLSSLRKFVSVLKKENLLEENPFEEINQTNEEQNYDYWHFDSFKDYLLQNNASKLTVKNYLSDIKGFASWYEQAILPTLISPLTSTNGAYRISQEIVQEYKDRLFNIQSSAPRTINRKLSSLRRYLEFGTNKGFINPGEIVLPSIQIGKEEAEPVKIQLKDLNQTQTLETKSYSSFPPARLLQKLVIFPYLLLEDAVASKVATIMTGKEMIAGIALSQLDKVKMSTRAIVNAQNQSIDAILGVRNVKKEFYAPHQVQLSGLPFHKKLLYHARYTRPKWYKTYHSYPFVHYAHFALLIIFAVGVGVAAYQNLVGKNQRPTFAAPTAPPRILSFQGRLTDASDNPITSATDIRFAIYNDLSASGAALLWQEVHYVVTPDQDGIFSVLLGTNDAIPSTVFSDNAGTYLGVTINQTSELTPRQRIAAVAYATNSEQLQGMPPITAGGAGTSNVVLALDSSGNLTIGGSAAPTFTASGGQFRLSGQPLVLNTNSSSNGNIVLAPDGLGRIDLQKPLVNSGTSGNITPGGVEVNDKFGVLATESGVASFVINNNGSSDIFTASSSGSPRFTISTTGALTIPTYNTNGGIFYANGSGVVAQTTAGSSGECLQSIGGGTPTWGSCGSGSGSLWRLSSGALSPINDTADVLIGSNATASAKFAFINVAGGTPTASISASSGNNWTTLSGDGILGTTNKQTLSIGNSSTGIIAINSPENSKTSIGTGSTLGTLKISGQSPGKALVNLQYLGSGQNILVASNSAGTNVFTIEEDGDIIVGNAGAGKLTAAIIDPYLIQNQYTSVTPELIFQTMAATSGDFIYKNQSTELARLAQAGQFQLPITGSSGGLVIGADTQLFRGSADRLDLASGDSFNLVSGSIQIGGTTVIDSSQNATFSSLTVTGGCTGCVSASDSPFKVLSGAIVPLNSTLDFTLGGQSSASAKFAVLNIGTGTPTASISANSGDNALYITGDGSLATTNRQSLTIGNSSTYNTTGNVLINSNATGNVGLRTATPTSFNVEFAGSLGPAVDNSSVLGSASRRLNSIYLGDGGLQAVGNAGTSGSVNINTAASAVTVTRYGQRILNNTLNTTTDGIDKYGLYINNTGSFTGLTGTSTNNYSLYISTPSGADNNYSIYSAGGTNYLAGNTGLGTTTPTALLDVAGTASVSGALKLYGTPTIQSTANQTLTLGGDTTGSIVLSPLNGSGTIQLTNFTTNGGLIYTNGSGVLAQTGAGSATQCLLGGTTPTYGSCATGTTVTPFQELTGAIVPNNSTLDFLIGGQATASAKFGILNIAGGTPTASISANNGNIATYLAGDGTLATTNRQTLTIGNSSTYNTTGEVLINPNGTGNVGVGTTSARSKFHVANAYSGQATPNASSILTIENNANAYLSFLTPANVQSGILFGSPTNSAQGQITYNHSSNYLNFYTGGADRARITSTGFGIGMTSPISQLHVSRSAAATGKALAVFDQTESQDIITASASGITKFAITNSGVLQLVGGQTSDIDTLTNATLNIGATNATTISIGRSSQGITLPGFTGQNGILYGTSGTGVLAQATTASTGLCLLSGAANPAWGTCPTTGNSSSNWTLNSTDGTLYPINSTLDVLIGNTASTSAKFAFLNVAGGVPTASISANTADNNTFLTGAGNLATTNKQTLTLGGSTTGGIVIDSGSSSINLADDTSITGNITGSGTTGLTLTGAGAGITFSGSGLHEIGASSGTLRIGTHTLTGAITGGNQNISSIGNISANSSSNTLTGFGTIGTSGTTAFVGTNLTLAGAATDITSGANQDLAITANGTGNLILTTDFDTSVKVGTSNNIMAPLSVSGGIGSNAGFILDQLNDGDLFTASAAGVTKFTFTNGGSLNLTGGQTIDTLASGTLGIGTTTATTLTLGRSGQGITLPGFTGQNGILYGTSGTGVLAQATTGTPSLCLLSGASNPTWSTCPTSGSSNWTLDTAAGVIRPNNNTVDFLLGGTATASAKFAVLGINGATVPTASLSATTASGGDGNGITLSGDGSIQSLRNNTLTLGGATTGSIQFKPGNISTPSLYLATGGNVGIGIAAPTELLHLYKTTGNYATLRFDSGTTQGYAFSYDGDNSVNIGANSSSLLHLRTSNAARATILASGEFGIGTTTPVSQLHVTRALSLGATGKALGIFDQIENQDIFTASSAGITKFVMGNDGRIGINTAASPTGVNPLAMLQVYSSLGTTPAASISATTANAVLRVDQNGVGDFIVASKAGQTYFKITASGDAEIGVNAGGKLNAGTVDPPYTIDGEGYATYMPSMIGVKEEYAGKAVLSYDSRAGAYVYKLDFNNFERQSDQWVYNRIIDPDISNVSVLMTPNSAARTWYKKDGTNRTITLYADRPVEISYRLTAPRFDHDKWKTYTGIPKGHIAPPPTINGSSENDNNMEVDPYFATLSINEENGQYVLKDSYNNKVNHIDAFSKTISAKIEAGWVQAKKITSDTISAGSANFNNLTASTLALTSDSITISGQNLRDFIVATVQNAGLTQNGNEIISPLASIDMIKTNVISPLAEEGSVALHINPNDLTLKNTQTGETVAKIDNQGNLNARSASFSGTLESEVALFDSASVSGNLATNTLQANNASVAGTLRADKIIANDIEGIDNRISSIANNLINTASGSGSFTDGGNLAVGSLNAQFGLFEQGIVSLGSGTFTQLTAMDSISIGQGFILGNNSINTLGADLEIQPLRQGNISFMAGRVTIDTDGNMAVDGNISIQGNLAAARGIFSDTIESRALVTNIISPLADKDLVFKLNGESFASNSGKLQIQNTQGNQVLAINNKGDIISSGSARFGKLNLSLVGKAEAINENEAVATGSAGFATLKRGRTELTIINPNVTKDSLIYVTPFGDTSNKVIYLLRQTPNEPENGIQGSFTVGVSGTTTTQDLQFNWLVVN